jgi:hypothetical protein
MVYGNLWGEVTHIEWGYLAAHLEEAPGGVPVT